MYKRIFILVLVFLFVAAVSLIALPALIFFVILGLSLCVFCKASQNARKESFNAGWHDCGSHPGLGFSSGFSCHGGFIWRQLNP